jgi:hypothetical protein
MLAKALVDCRSEPRNYLASPQLTSPPLADPGDWNGMIFLPRAFEVIGSHYWPEDWTGLEQTASVPEALPDVIGLGLLACTANPSAFDAMPARWSKPPTQSMLLRADCMLRDHRPDLARPLLGGLGMQLAIPFTVSEWRAAQEIDRGFRRTALALTQRRDETRRTIVRMCESGELETALLPLFGGEFTPALPTSLWRTTNYGPRFESFRMSAREPFGTPHWSETEWIYLTERSVKRATNNKGAGSRLAADQDGVEYESEYMVCMREVVQALGITTANQPKKLVVEAKIRELWRGDDGLSEVMIGYMASFVRTLAASGGRRPKSGSP